MRGWVKAISVAALTVAAAVWADPSQYTLESANGKTFVVRDHLGRPRTFKAKRTCLGIRSSHKVMFDRGGPNVTCISAEIRDLVTNATCPVWCMRPPQSKLAVKIHAGASRQPGRETNLLDLSRPPEHADAGTRELPHLGE